MGRFIINIFIIFLIFHNIFFSSLNLPSFFSYWDEFIEVLVIIIGIIYVVKHKSKISLEYLKIYLLIAMLIVIGLCGNICFEYNTSIDGIFRDIVALIKFPIVYLIIKQIKFDEKMKKSLNNGFIFFIKFIITLMFVLGIISLFNDIGLSQNEIRYGIKPYKFLFGHPTYLVLCCTYLLAFIESIKKTKKDCLIYELMLFAIIILSMRTKGIVFLVLYIFIKYIGKWLKKFKALYGGTIIGVGFLTAYNKLALYSSFSSSPREVLYKGALLLTQKCFPFGSGFATFASHISGKYNSLVYNFIQVPYTWLESGNEMAVLGDAGFPYYIGQFGFIGTIIFIILIIKIYKLTIKKIENKIPVMLICLYIIVALTSESILLNNGLELAFILAYIACLNKKSNNDITKTKM